MFAQSLGEEDSPRSRYYLECLHAWMVLFAYVVEKAKGGGVTRGYDMQWDAHQALLEKSYDRMNI